MSRTGTENTDPIVIAGAGPTGLLLGIMLAKQNLPFLIYEPRAEVSPHSRSIGIHPPSLSLFQEAGIEKPFLEKGNKITTGRAWVEGKPAGSIPFNRLSHPFPFILTLSQQITEEILEQELLYRASGSLKRGISVEGFSEEDDHILVKLSSGEEVRAVRLIACDGKNSTVRQAAGIAFKGGDYPDRYVMGDFLDNTGNRDEARVFLSSRGLTESFPHGKNLRRWVLKVEKQHDDPDPEWIAQEAHIRTGTAPDSSTNSMISTFGVQRYLAETFFRRRIILAGDAAHIVSPIGGQGMNLGWFDAALLAGLLPDILNTEKPRPKLIHSYEYRRRNAAYKAAQRAEFNMRMGREFPAGMAFFRRLVVRGMLLPPFRGKLLKNFTMDGLD